MKNKHFDDLTEIDCPMGMLDDDTLLRLQNWPHGWETFCGRGVWEPSLYPKWYVNVVYRARPAPPTQDVIPWASTAKKFKWFARCGNREDLGRFYIQQPQLNPSEISWYSEHYSAPVTDFGGDYTMGTVDWQDSLQFRPDGV